MTFEIKSFAQITQGAINRARAVTDKITDFLPGSVARTLIEAPASEIEELYIQMLLGLRDAIPVATYLSFGFDKLPASVASGFVTLALDPPPVADSVIPAGASFSASDGRRYLSTADTPWPAGAASIRVPVVAAVVGAAGNAAAGDITSTALSDRPYSVGNPAISNGRDLESDLEQRARFADFIAALSRGTMVACRFAVASATVADGNGNITEYVTRVGAQEEAGYVRFWLYSNLGIPSDELLALAQRQLDGWSVNGVIVPGYRPAGVRVEALPMAERDLPMTIRVSMYPGFNLDAGAIQRITDVFESAVRAVPSGESIYLKSLIESMLAVDGVRAIVPDRSENIYCAPSEALVPGDLTVLPL